ncbi:hypothetical protein HMPREF0322_01800 [Desulfitobacterium hafniense DP7]|uniref:Uncharacterized protein n=1 Tax=Desulfitobacterium hafniense DP7 TaxID=537010 RepID=G9XLG6_DESHA|nr:hypothetical protein [Desulfitobacterium hafniense]EHL07451.1 hypothetical protein HMPREF0322_01800 [Desulfitobacterium hafniense DP7]
MEIIYFTKKGNVLLRRITDKYKLKIQIIESKRNTFEILKGGMPKEEMTLPDVQKVILFQILEVRNSAKISHK